MTFIFIRKSEPILFLQTLSRTSAQGKGFTEFTVYICRIDILKYVIYGVAAAFFVYGILLMVEGFFTTGAIRDLYGDFKITTCGRCVSAWVRQKAGIQCGYMWALFSTELPGRTGNKSTGDGK